ncbi:MAG: PilX N-terminal domain-containing pilus assembly protein [Bacillota bacterium]
MRRGHYIKPTRPRAFASRGDQSGASLIVTLLMLTVLAMVGLSAAQISLQDEKASRNERDREIAMQAAEAALADAELDIESAPRSFLFASDSSEGFAPDCNNGQTARYLGLCLSGRNIRLAWQAIDFASAKSVPYGHFTGRMLPAGAGPLPMHAPRYIIELMPDDEAGGATQETYHYRITAIGFGAANATRVMLQTLYRKAGKGGKEQAMPVGRLSWREIPNWKELHDALARK